MRLRQLILAILTKKDVYSVCVYFSSRLDAGTFGTMGVGLGFAIAAAVLVKYEDDRLDPPASRVVCIQGDSAFGFSGMELETVMRFVQPLLLLLQSTTTYNCHLCAVNMCSAFCYCINQM